MHGAWDIVSNPGLITVCLLQQTRLWPSSNQYTDARTRKKQFDERKQACLVQKFWAVATFKGLTLFRQNVLNFLLLRLSSHGDSRSGFSSTIPGRIGIWKNLDKYLIHKFHTLLPFIFMTGVQPPGPHPKSPIWQRTEVGVELKKSLTSWLRWDLHKSQGGHFGK